MLTLLAAVRALGITLTPDGETIRIKPASRLPPHLRAQLRAAKPEILAALRAEAATQEPPAEPTPIPRPFRTPSWSDPTDTPTEADTCSCCRHSVWWTEQHGSKGWCCMTCHPPLHLAPDAVRRIPTPPTGD
jgi:hypothetical protein